MLSNFKMKHISQEDIAQELGIAVSSVSRAITGKPGVSAALRERIRAMAQEHNYRHSFLLEHPEEHREHGAAERVLQRGDDIQ